MTRWHTDRACGAVRPQRTEPGAPLVGARSVAGPVELEVIQSRGHGQRWNEYVDRYHYLGYRQPFGCQLRYFMASSAGVLGWVQVRHRASQVLGPLARRGRRDWPARWGYAPLGLETCVAPDRFAGTCYRAAGGPALARTTGRGLARAGQSYPSTPKLIYVPGLAADFRPQLCGGPLARRVEL